MDEKEAHLWRSKVIRLLTFPGTETSAGGASVHATLDGYKARRLVFCDDFARSFLETPVKHLIRKSQLDSQIDQVFESLKTVVQFATEVSSRLWSRRTSLKVHGMASLLQTPFSAESHIMEAHAIHRIYEGDTECDGWRVGIVVHPVVMGLGNSDRTDYKTERVWMKAEVVLLEPVRQADDDEIDWNMAT